MASFSREFRYLMSDVADAMMMGLGLFCIAVLLLGPILSLAAYNDYSKCVNGWAKGGRKVEWGFFTGCFVEVQPGNWMSTEVLRDVQLR